MRWAIAMLLTLSLATDSGASGDVAISEDFESASIGETPSGWRPFTAGKEPAVEVIASGAGQSQKCVRIERSEFGGMVALSKELPTPASRISVEFSVAFAPNNKRVFHIWSHEPAGRDASQLNLCIQQGKLQFFDGRTRSWKTVSQHVAASDDPENPIWHRMRIVADQDRSGLELWVSTPGSLELNDQPTATIAAYRTNLPISGIDLVSGTRIAAGAWALIDDLVVRSGTDLTPPAEPPKLPAPFVLWNGPPIPAREAIPFVPGIQHHTIHRATADGYKFLHGAAIAQHRDTLFANWANSPTNENGPHETLQGRRSNDGGATWSDIEMIGPGFDGPERHSHGVLAAHQGRLWSICARFGVGSPAKRFAGLAAEAFTLDEQVNRWQSIGIVMRNCWPYDEPVRLANGNFITGGQDRDGLPVVAISQGDDWTRWDTVAIPFPPDLAPGFAETTVETNEATVLAVIRGGGNIAWVATSADFGRTWTEARPSNLPMPRAKAYLGRFSSGELYLISNLVDRDTLVISVGAPGEMTLERMWRIRHGRSIPPRFPGAAKGKQWSYPYGHEHNGRLYVVYSIGKEDCGLSVLPVEALTTRREQH